MRTDALERMAMLAFGATLWACVAAVAGLVAYRQTGLVGGLVAVVAATLLVGALATAVFRTGLSSRR